MQRNAITHEPRSTLSIAASFGVIDTIAVADVETVLTAVMPNRVLHEPRERPRKRRIELACIDPLRHALKNLSTSTRPIAGRSIGVLGAKSPQNAGPMQKIMHQCVDRNHAAAGLVPAPHACWSAEQQQIGRAHV